MAPVNDVIPDEIDTGQQEEVSTFGGQQYDPYVTTHFAAYTAAAAGRPMHPVRLVRPVGCPAGSGLGQEPVNIVLPPLTGHEDPYGNCATQCEEAARAREVDCEIIRKRIALYLENQGCPSIVRAYKKRGGGSKCKASGGSSGGCHMYC